MFIALEEPFRTLWRGLDPFAEVEKISGPVYRAVHARRTLRFEVGGRGYFLKLHHGTELKDVLKDLLWLKKPTLGAEQEWRASRRLGEAGVGTLRAVAYGSRGWNPLHRTSFIITEDLCPETDLDDCWRRWSKEVPPQGPAARNELIRGVARLVREMHRAGVNHRDCYLCHFLMAPGFDGTAGSLRLHLIDLHRAQIRRRVPRRWRDKDLSQLYYSASEHGLTQRDIFRFLREYFQEPLRDILRREKLLFAVARWRHRRIARHTLRLISREGHS